MKTAADVQAMAAMLPRIVRDLPRAIAYIMEVHATVAGRRIAAVAG
jgi:hypothetical protein